MSNIVAIYDGDLRIQSLCKDLESVIAKYTDNGLSAAAVVGAMEIMKADLLKKLLGYD